MTTAPVHGDGPDTGQAEAGINTQCCAPPSQQPTYRYVRLEMRGAVYPKLQLHEVEIFCKGQNGKLEGVMAVPELSSAGYFSDSSKAVDGDTSTAFEGRGAVGSNAWNGVQLTLTLDLNTNSCEIDYVRLHDHGKGCPVSAQHFALYGECDPNDPTPMCDNGQLFEWKHMREFRGNGCIRHGGNLEGGWWEVAATSSTCLRYVPDGHPSAAFGVPTGAHDGCISGSWEEPSHPAFLTYAAAVTACAARGLELCGPHADAPNDDTMSQASCRGAGCGFDRRPVRRLPPLLPTLRQLPRHSLYLRRGQVWTALPCPRPRYLRLEVSKVGAEWAAIPKPNTDCPDALLALRWCLLPYPQWPFVRNCASWPGLAAPRS